MMKITCPHCSARLSAKEDVIGRKVRCRQCREKFRVPASENADSPKPASPELQLEDAPEPVSSPATEPFESRFPEIDTSAVDTCSDDGPTTDVNLPESARWTDLFDFKFRSFLAPRIVSVIYVMGMLTIAIYFLVATWFFGRVLIGITNDSNSAVVAQQAMQQLVQNRMDRNERLPIPHALSKKSNSKSIAMLLAVLTYFTSCLSLLVCWLMLRLICETLIIHFYNGSTLKRIEAKL